MKLLYWNHQDITWRCTVRKCDFVDNAISFESVRSLPLVIDTELVRIFKRKGTVLFASFVKRFKPILRSERKVFISQNDMEIEELQRPIQEDERIEDVESQAYATKKASSWGQEK